MQNPVDKIGRASCIPNKFTSETITKKPLIYSFDNVLDGEKERKTEMIIISSIM